MLMLLTLLFKVLQGYLFCSVPQGFLFCSVPQGYLSDLFRKAICSARISVPQGDLFRFFL